MALGKRRRGRRLDAFVADAGLKLGDVIHAVRVAIPGKTVGPGLYDCLAILGASKSIARIDRARMLAGE